MQAIGIYIASRLYISTFLLGSCGLLAQDTWSRFVHTHSVSKVLYLLVVRGDFQGPQDPLRLPNQTCSYHSLAGLYTKLNRQIHKKSGFSGRILGVVLSGGFGLKIGYPIGQIWVNAHDHTSTVQDVCSHCIILRSGVRAMYHRGMLTVRCS